MLDNIGAEQFSTQDADAVVANCDPGITPIFPVRYALADHVMRGFANSSPNLAAPSGLNPSNHDLRILRAGYVFIYAAAGHKEGEHSDKKGIWHAFRYYVGPDDANSTTGWDILQTTINGRYSFAPYRWKDGNAGGEWELLTERRYPYAYVHKDVSEIHIAYSEEIWPSWLFEKLETDKAARDLMMTPVNLTAQRTAQSAPLSELSKHVRGFGDTPRNPLENAMRQTALQPDRYSRVVNCPNARDKGRIVAIHDPLGEILDLGQLHEIYADSQRQYARAYQYPMAIGAVVKRHEAQINARDGFLQDNPIRPSYGAAYQALIDGSDAIQNAIDACVKGLIRILNRTGPGSALEEVKLVIGDLGAVTTYTKFRRAEYSCSVLQRALEPFAASAAGQLVLQRIVDDDQNSATSLARDLFQTTMEAYMKANYSAIGTSISGVRAPFFNVLVEVVAAQIALGYLKTQSISVSMGAVMKVGGFTHSGRIGVPADEIDTFIRSSIRGMGFSEMPLKSATLDGGTIRRRSNIPTEIRANLIEVPGFQAGAFNGTTGRIQATITPTAGTINRLQIGEIVSTGGNGVGAVVSLTLVFQSAASWDEKRYTVTSVGAFAYDPKVAMVAALLDFGAAATGVRSLSSAQALSRGVSAELFGMLFPRVPGSAARFLNARVVTAGITTLPNGAATLGGKAASVLGKIAGWVGVVLAGAVAFERFMAGDTTSAAGNGLIAIGGAIMLVFGSSGIGLVVGFVVIVVGVVVSLFGRDDVGDWIATTFWGDSFLYWGTWRPNDTDQITMATVLRDDRLDGHDEMYNRLKEELERYEDVALPPVATNATDGDYAVEIDYPPARSRDAFEDMDVDITFHAYLASRPTAAVAGSRDAVVTYVSPGVLRATMSAAHRRYIDRFFQEGTAQQIGQVSLGGTLNGKRVVSARFSWPP